MVGIGESITENSVLVDGRYVMELNTPPTFHYYNNETTFIHMTNREILSKVIIAKA